MANKGFRPRRGTKLYQCRECGKTITAELPADLKGEFAHVRCAGDKRDYDILSRQYLSDGQ